MTGKLISPITATAFDRLRVAIADWLPLEPLDPVEYATGHALFEARSDQRARLTEWLVERLGCRSVAPSRVLSIGCGDGSVDMHVAAALARRGEPVDYTGIEPHAPSGRTFMSRLDDVPGVNATVMQCPFERADPTGRYDVVLALHSLYYVADVAATIERAGALLAPGGELIVLHAPSAPLNVLVHLLAPGRRQQFSAEVAAHFHTLGLRPQISRIGNRLDLSATGDAEIGARLLSFTVQARVPLPLRPLVRAALSEVALPGPGVVLDHPVYALVLRG